MKNKKQNADRIGQQELIEKLYVSQLLLLKEIDSLRNNVIELRKRIQPEAFTVEMEDTNENPFYFKSYNELQDMINSAETTLKKELMMGAE